MFSHLISQNLLLEVLLEVMIFDLVRTIFPARNLVRARFSQMLENTGVWLYLTTFALIPCIACITRNLVHACSRLGRLASFEHDLVAACCMHAVLCMPCTCLIPATCPIGIWLKRSPHGLSCSLSGGRASTSVLPIARDVAQHRSKGPIVRNSADHLDEQASLGEVTTGAIRIILITTDQIHCG